MQKTHLLCLVGRFSEVQLCPILTTLFFLFSIWMLKPVLLPSLPTQIDAAGACIYFRQHCHDCHCQGCCQGPESLCSVPLYPHTPRPNGCHVCLPDQESRSDGLCSSPAGDSYWQNVAAEQPSNLIRAVQFSDSPWDAGECRPRQPEAHRRRSDTKWLSVKFGAWPQSKQYPHRTSFWNTESAWIIVQ